MKCQDFQDNLVAYLEESLDPVEQTACREHLAECTNCRMLAKSSAALQNRLVSRGPLTSDSSMVDTVMERIEQKEAEERPLDREEPSFMQRLLEWRWSFSMGAVAAVLIIFAILGGPNLPSSAAEIMIRGANAVKELTRIHLRGKLRTDPKDNFSAIAPEREFAPIELWKEFKPIVKWRIDKPGRTAIMDGRETMLLIQPDYAVKYPTPSNSAFDTQWLHEIANLGQLLSDEVKAIRSHGWKTTVTRQPGQNGLMQSVVSIEARTGITVNDYLKNKFFGTADTRRVYTFDEGSGLPVSARIYLKETASEDMLLFELDLIEGNTQPASDVFQMRLPEGVTWKQKMEILPDNQKYESMTSEQAAKAFFEACGREDWNEAGKFCNVTGSLKKFLGGIQVIRLEDHFTSVISLISGAEFVPYEIKLKDGNIRKHNLALKRDRKTNRWFIDGGI